MKINAIKILKPLLFMAAFSLFFSCKNHVSKKNTLHTVSGKVTQKKLYCGGARPTEKMLEDLKKPIPYPNKSFYIKKIADDYTNQKILLNFTSNNLGEFMFQLKPGSYAVFLDEQINKVDFSILKNQTLDEKCYDGWLKKPYATVEVKNENINYLEFNIAKKCFITKDIPCLRYTGPLPQ